MAAGTPLQGALGARSGPGSDDDLASTPRLATGVVVKVMNRSLNDGTFYKQKGTVENLVGRCAPAASAVPPPPYRPRLCHLAPAPYPAIGTPPSRNRLHPASDRPTPHQITGRRYTAHVRMHADGKLIKLDQDELETVIPQASSIYPFL